MASKRSKGKSKGSRARKRQDHEQYFRDLAGSLLSVMRKMRDMPMPLDGIDTMNLRGTVRTPLFDAFHECYRFAAKARLDAARGNRWLDGGPGTWSAPGKAPKAPTPTPAAPTSPAPKGGAE